MMVRLTSLAALAAASFLPTALSAATPRAEARRAVEGEWSEVIKLPVISIAAYVVPRFPESNRVLLFSAYRNDTFGGASGKTQFADLNFETGVVSHREVADTNHDMFCPGISQLADGRINIQGGSNAEVTTLYDPATNTFTRGSDLAEPRGYQTSTILSNGKVFTIGGAFSGELKGKNGEIYDPSTDTWTGLPGADVTPILTDDPEGVFRADNHAWLVGWKNGSVFQAGPSKDQHWYYTTGNGSLELAGTRDTDHSMCGVWALYDAVKGKIFSAGGSPFYTNSDATNRAHITTIGEAGEPSTVQRVADMAFPRGFADANILPDGTILVTGGQRRSRIFTDIDATLIPDLYDPETDTWTQLAPESVPRTYHSVSILLADGRVFSGGGGACDVKPGDSDAHCDRTIDHSDGQIFSPPYLFNANGTEAARPVISDLAQEPVKAGASLSFTISEPLKSLSLIRLGSVTHSVNSDQRRIPLAFDIVEGAVATQLPSDYGILVPGFYYLFAVSEQGVPSIGKSVHVIL